MPRTPRYHGRPDYLSPKWLLWHIGPLYLNHQSIRRRKKESIPQLYLSLGPNHCPQDVIPTNGALSLCSHEITETRELASACPASQATPSHPIDSSPAGYQRKSWRPNVLIQKIKLCPVIRTWLHSSWTTRKEKKLLRNEIQKLTRNA